MPQTFTDADFADAPPAAPAPAAQTFTDADFADAPPAPAAAPAPEQPAAPEVSAGESFLRGAGQGATLGWSDEIVGLGKALFSGKSNDYMGSEYRRARDAEREANHAAQAAHPGWYTGGNVAGNVATSFIPGLGIAKGAGVLGTALGAAKIGAIGGLGESEASDLGGQLWDAGKSAALSGVTAGVVSKLIGGAPKRVIERELGDVTDGATATMRDRVVGKAGNRVGDVLDVVREKTFKQAGRDPNKLLDATEQALRATGDKLDSAYASAGAKTAGIRVSDVLGRVEDIANRLGEDPGKADLARAVSAKAEDVLNAWGNRTHVPASDVRVLASDIADAAFRGSPSVAPKAAQSTAQEVWGALKDLISQNLDEAGKGGSTEIAALNKRMSTLMNIREAVQYRATREATASTRLTDRMSHGLDIALGVTSPTAFAAKKAYDYVGKPVGRALDSRLAEIVQLAAQGNTKAIITKRAVELGFSPVVAGALSAWADKQAAELNGGQ